MKALALSVFAMAFAGRVQAETTGTAASPEIFEGYLTEQVGEVRWVYPDAAADLLEDLREVKREGWAEIAAELGGQIDPRIEIRIAIDPERMQGLAPGGARLPDYATGVAFPREGVILLSLTAPMTWEPTAVKRVLAHELSHLALHRAVQGRPLPRWFSEGVAIRHADEVFLGRVRALWEAVVRDRLISLQKLSRAFPARYQPANLAYAQSSDFVAYLLDGTDNQRRFRELIAALRGGAEFEKAVFDAYDVSLGYLEREWRQALQERFRRLPLLLTGVGTIWVLAIVLLGLGYVRMKNRKKATLERWARQEALERPVYHDPVAIKPSPAEKQEPLLTEEQKQIRDKAGVPTIEFEGRDYTVH